MKGNGILSHADIKPELKTENSYKKTGNSDIFCINFLENRKKR